MKIISKFRDYYDSACSYGVDESIIYYRQRSEMDLSRFLDMSIIKESLFVNWRCFVGNTIEMNLYCDTYVVGFCEKLYPCLHLQYKDPIKPTIEKYCYDMDDVYTFYHMLPSRIIPFMVGRFETKDKSIWGKQVSKSNVTQHFNLSGVEMPNLFRELNTPVFVVKDFDSIPVNGKVTDVCMVELNARLIELDFFRVIDPYQAHQRVSMYLSGVLGLSEPEVLDISDECMRDAKGFNEKSFKTRKGQKTRKGKR